MWWRLTALDRYPLGNLNWDSIRELDEKRKELGFIKESAVVQPECVQCKWRMLCRSGCRRSWKRVS